MLSPGTVTQPSRERTMSAAASCADSGECGCFGTRTEATFPQPQLKFHLTVSMSLIIQEYAHDLVDHTLNAWRARLARTGNVEGSDGDAEIVAVVTPFAQLRQCFVATNFQVDTLDLTLQVDTGSYREPRSASERRPDAEDHSGLGRLDVESCSRWVAVDRRLFEAIPLRDSAILCEPTLRAPSAVRNTNLDGGVQGAAVSAGLTTTYDAFDFHAAFLPFFIALSSSFATRAISADTSSETDDALVDLTPSAARVFRTRPSR